jgi:hypothetical protein
MKRSQIVALVALAVLAVLVILLALRNPQPPVLPSDEIHGAPAGFEACLVCHGPHGDAPRSNNHPLGNDCARCHGRH